MVASGSITTRMTRSKAALDLFPVNILSAKRERGRHGRLKYLVQWSSDLKDNSYEPFSVVKNTEAFKNFRKSRKGRRSRL